jgi:DNA-binding MarR family transcriptional regulator
VQLAQRLGLDKSTLSRTIDGLVDIGLVDRLPNPSDRRFTPLSVTEQGKAVCNVINRSADDYYGRVFENIPQEKHEAVIKNLSLLVQVLLDEENLQSAKPES